MAKKKARKKTTRKMKPSTKKKIGKALKDKKRGPMKSSTKKKIGKALKGKKRGPMKQITKNKIGKALKGRKKSPAHIAKIKKAMRKAWKSGKLKSRRVVRRKISWKKKK